jgi:gliding motility-associated-like protein
MKVIVTKCFILLILFFPSINGKSQNLVPNPSFEEYYTISFNPPCFRIPCCLLAKPTEWNYANIAYWPGLYGPHYFTCQMNYCIDDEYPLPAQGVPVHNWNGAPYTLNGFYYQEPKDGCAYIIFGTYMHHFNYGVYPNKRTYPYVQLSQALVPGERYCLSFWLSIPDINYYMTSNTIGAHFSTTPMVQHNDLYMDITPHIENWRTDYPDTSDTWYLVSGSFVADSSYQYLTIGNFYPDTLTNVVIDSANLTNIGDFTFYLDMVALYNCTGHTYECNAGGNKTICAGDAVQLGSDDVPSRQYQWSPARGLNNRNAARPIASPTQTTTYYLYVVDEYTQASFDTVTVEVLQCDLFIPNIFSPNNDGENDVLYVRGHGIVDLHFVVFNRWGQLVFESKDEHHGWDGKVNGKPAQVGVYAWQLYAKLNNGAIVNRRGNVTLVR